MRKQQHHYIRFIIIFLIVFLTGCDVPVLSDADSGPTATQWVVYVTATAEGAQVAEADIVLADDATQPPIGPFAGGLAPTVDQVVPEATIDPAVLESVPTAIVPLPTATASPTPAVAVGDAATPTPTPLVSVATGAPTEVATESSDPTAIVVPTSTSVTATEEPTVEAAETEIPTQEAQALPPAAPYVAGATEYSGKLGLNFISSAQHQADAARFAAGIGTGAGWDRFAIYWNDIEQEHDKYTWAIYDQTVRQDVENGLQTNGILLGTPHLYYDGSGAPVGIYEPVFNDGTDHPGQRKQINSGNPWAEFVYATVLRYKPYGELATVEGWDQGEGIRVWEIWNEPDFSMFWQGSVHDYARLLKVAYIAAKQADPAAQIMVGGLVIWEKPNWMIDLLNVYKDDPDPVDQRYPFDMLALHAYSRPQNTFELVLRNENLLALYGLGQIPIWVNESGVPVWNDYPGPEWATRPDQIIWRASESEQASYLVQNAAYAFLSDVDVLFHFQLYDDCGNQPRGTTFAPHNGGLCDTGAVCWGDALGLMRNSDSNVCFNQHPAPNTPRLSYSAFRTVADVFAAQDVVPLAAERFGSNGSIISLMLARPATREIITVLWNESGTDTEAVVESRGTQATLIDMLGEFSTIEPDDEGAFRLNLRAATNRNQPGLPAGTYMIGGPPLIIIEQAEKPVVSVTPMLEHNRSALLVKWRSSDSSIEKYEVWYRDDSSGDEWVRWFETDTPGDALFVGGEGHTYSFFARGQLPDGSWTAAEAYPQARTILSR